MRKGLFCLGDLQCTLKSVVECEEADLISFACNFSLFHLRMGYKCRFWGFSFMPSSSRFVLCAGIKVLKQCEACSIFCDTWLLGKILLLFLGQSTFSEYWATLCCVMLNKMMQFLPLGGLLFIKTASSINPICTCYRLFIFAWS